MSELTIRDMDQGEDFAEWFADLLHKEEARIGGDVAAHEHYLVLTDEIGDWIGGVRYALRGGVAQLLDIAVEPEQRHHGHGRLLLAAFESRAEEAGAHVAEFWTDDTRTEPILIQAGWNKVMERPEYVGRRTWALMEKRFDTR
jgi:GNAT superfamily N-acetyltransferase